MNLRWIAGNFADPEYGLSRQQQRKVTRLAHKKYLRPRTLAIWTAIMVIASYLVFGFGWEHLTGLLQSVGLPYARASAGLFIVIAVSVMAAWLYRFIYIKPIRRAMRELGFDICVGCGYRLQGLGNEVKQCPECGAGRDTMDAGPTYGRSR